MSSGICPYCGYACGFRRVHRACKLKYELRMKDMKDYGEQYEQTDIKLIYRQAKKGVLVIFIIGYGLLGSASVLIRKDSFGWLVFEFFS
jgi:hypothetical protein